MATEREIDTIVAVLKNTYSDFSEADIRSGVEEIIRIKEASERPEQVHVKTRSELLIEDISKEHDKLDNIE